MPPYRWYRVRGHRPSVHGGHITHIGPLVDGGSEAPRSSTHAGHIGHGGLLVDVGQRCIGLVHMEDFYAIWASWLM